MINAVDQLFLERALELAEAGRFTTTPNPTVGCVLVRDSVVIGRGAHLKVGGAHAEVAAIADAGGDAIGATAYVSLEPCAFTGRTGPCTQALLNAGVVRVVGALTDPHPRVSGAGYEALRDAGLDVEAQDLPQAQEAVAGYVSRVVRGRPYVRLKVAHSLDGRTAMASGESQWITGPDARADVQYWRARSCAIVTGSGTVRADDPALTVRDETYRRDGEIRQPLRVVLDSRSTLDDEAQVFTGPGESMRVTAASGARVDLAELCADLGRRMCNEVLVEAGPELVGGFLAAGLWDELLVYVAPKLLGSGARPLASLELATMADALTGTIQDVAMLGDDLRLRIRPTVPAAHNQ